MPSRMLNRVAQRSGVAPVNWTLLRLLRPHWLGRRGIPPGRLVYRDPKPVTDDDLELCTRLIDAYARATATGETATTGMWLWIFNERQRELAEALERRDSEALASLLAAMFRQRFLVGIAPGDLVSYSRSRLGARIWWLKGLDGLVSLAEALGVVAVENPEQGGLQAFGGGVQALVEAIEADLVFTTDIPDVGAAYGMEQGGRLIPLEWPEQIYAAARMRTVGATRSVVEIGAGYGALAYWAMRLNDVERYTIVDLPIVNVLQGYFLTRAGGDVSLFGEPEATIDIVPNTALHSIATPVDLVVNKDSMPEMPEQAMLDYLTWARSSCRVFFSYNQEASAEFHGEAQNIVPRGVAAVGGFERLRRDPSWVRRGYVEEIYRVTGTPG